jgi:hypothetical protein
VGAGVLSVAIQAGACQENGGIQAPGPYTVDTYVVGDTNVPDRERSLTLPEEGSRDLNFPDGGGTARYHVILVLTDGSVLAWFSTHADEVLAAVDEVLLRHGLAELQAGGSYGDIEDDLLNALDHLYATTVGTATDDLAHAELEIDSLPAAE